MVDIDDKKEIVYPDLSSYKPTPSAPPIYTDENNNNNDIGHSYRLKKISEVEKILEEEVNKRDELTKKYFRAAKIVCNVDSVLIGITTVTGVGGITLLSTLVAVPAVIALEVGAAVTGFLSLFGKYVENKTKTKGEKHQKIKVLASAKLNTTTSHISKALMDNEISNDEFNLIMEELIKYKEMKKEMKKKKKKNEEKAK